VERVENERKKNQTTNKSKAINIYSPKIFALIAGLLLGDFFPSAQQKHDKYVYHKLTTSACE
jgi:hypothetical protein